MAHVDGAGLSRVCQHVPVHAKAPSSAPERKSQLASIVIPFPMPQLVWGPVSIDFDLAHCRWQWQFSRKIGPSCSWSSSSSTTRDCAI